MGTICRNSMTSGPQRPGTSRLCTTSTYVQRNWYVVQEAKPTLIKTQNSLARPRFLRILGRQERAAERRSRHWTTSLKATKPNPRQCSRKDPADTMVCATTRHTNAVVHALERSNICPVLI